MANLKSKVVLPSAPVELEFQQWPTNINHINCYIPRLYALPLCRRSWWRWNNAKLLRALPSLRNISTSLPVSLPHQGGEKTQCCGSGPVCIAPQCFDDQRYIKVWPSLPVILTLTWCHFCYGSCRTFFVSPQTFVLYNTNPCKAI